MLPPLTIQMLLENAIKHNIITETAPLVISITEKDDYLVVANTLNKSNEATSSGTGLSNIRQRYAHFTDQPVKVSDTNGQFEVRIPLLEIEHS
jgi:LytS/YehU family sensor histidine kinase